MSVLRFELFTMPGADVGPENPLPPFARGRDLHAAAPAPGTPPEIAANLNYGHLPGILPYSMQDRYSRQRRPRAFSVAVLENDQLRATFLLELGGRLWSLVHKPSGRELLAVNPVFQPANLALRNAWFSGGVEWNIGTIGHCPFTCSPLHAARVDGPRGTPVLRLYEWERMRGVPFQIDAWLPDGSPVLLIRVRIRNPHDQDVPMYWWSNMAAPETPETRVLVPASSTYRFNYTGGFARVPVPAFEGTDLTYPVRGRVSMDFFFDIPDGRRHWIAALDAGGRGLVQTSTALLKGRKLFMWGTGSGGRRWQEFLAQPGFSYLEIQAGLARTQAEHVRMPARAEWSWLEAYGLMEAAPERVHGSDWQAATAEVESRLEALAPCAWLEAEHRRTAEQADTAPRFIAQPGSGWGALERRRRAAAGERPFCGAELPFADDTLGPPQAPWLDLLERDVFPAPPASVPPAGFMVQPEWRARLESHAATDPGNWCAWLHLGVMRAYAGETEGAHEAWRQSTAAAANPWALRNRAALMALHGQPAEAAELYLAAHAAGPGCVPLTVETCAALLKAARPRDALAVITRLDPVDRAHGRIRFLEAQAALDARELDTVARILDEGIEVSDLREGERSIDALWFAYHEQRISAAEGAAIDDAFRARIRRDFPVPPHYDFRMT